MAANNVQLLKVFGAVPTTTRAVALVLGDDPRGNNFLYTCGSNVFIRNLDDPSICDIYGEHAKEATVAKYAPSGFYIASGDAGGNIRIWDTVNKEHILKAEYQILGGKINDISWSEDSQRIVCVGEGRERYGAAFIMDTGASVGSIDGHSKFINSVDFKKTRPYRVATGSEDFTTNFYHGPPFKMDHSRKEHKRFVNSVRFSPDGTKFVTCSSDKRGLVYDGKTGEPLGELNTSDGQAHTGGIYACAWSPDSAQLLTASADRTAKVWNMTTFECVQTFTFSDSTDADFQQLGCLWSGQHMITVSLNGDINYLDTNNPARPARVLKGHNRFVMAVAYDAERHQVVSASFDGRIVAWNLNDWYMEAFSGAGHSNMVVALDIAGSNLISGSMDDTVRITSLTTHEYDSVISIGQPVKDVAALNGDATGAAVACLNKVVLIRGHAAVTEVALPSPECVAVNADDSLVAVGCSDGIHIFDLSGNTLTFKQKLTKHRTGVTEVAFSKNGTMLAGVDTSRDIVVWTSPSFEEKIVGWCHHTARINSLAWCPDNIHLASGSLDSDIIVWNTEVTTARITIPRANRGGVNSVCWIDANTIASAGQDCAVKTWSITY